MSEREEVLLSVRNEEDVSPECLAWADSCINSYPDDSDNNDWGNFRVALTEIIDIHPEMFVPGTQSFSSPDDEEMTETDIQTFVTEAEEASEIVSLLTFESDPSNNSLEDGCFVESMAKKGRIRKALESCASTEDVERIEEDGEAEEMLESLLAYAVKDDYMSSQDSVDDGSNVFVDLVKETPQEIFKVWELDVAGDNGEEDGIVLQLKEALDVSSTVQSLPQTLSHDQVVAEKSSIDDLIAGISDLSLVETFK